MFEKACNFDFQSKEEGFTKRLKGGLVRFEMDNDATDPGLVIGMECFWEQLDSFKYPHVVLLLDLYTQGTHTFTKTYMRIERTKTRDSCYSGYDRQAVRNGNPFRKAFCNPTIIETVVFREPVPFHIFRTKFLQLCDLGFLNIRRNCKWFALTIWEHILTHSDDLVYGADDQRIIDALRESDCKKIRSFMSWTYWWGSWILQ